MKWLILILSILTFSICKGYCQEFTTIDDIKSLMLELPIDSDKANIIKVAKERFKNNKIDSFVIQAKTKIYFEDSSITCTCFSGKPVLTKLKIYEFLNFSDQQNKGTTFFVEIDAYFGSDSKAERKMFSQYNELKNMFEDRFVSQKPYSYYADSKIAEGLRFLFSENEKYPVFSIGWSNGGCFPSYHVSVSFRNIK